MESNSVCNRTSDQQNRTTAWLDSNLFIHEYDITDRIGRHEVLLPSNHNYNKICEGTEVKPISLYLALQGQVKHSHITLGHVIMCTYMKNHTM